ncbi:MAG TPA: hypothetical protein DCZ95_09915 [Verrucomicrobia bacterium]|nr:MAG: hypothetical protein A2X46_00135 [Lentisphaerae bacterium GWF2_57_35]HBA84396.1 hypothetical protein [Verrucomicrobiota bacterium]
MEQQAIVRKLESILDLPTLPLVVDKVREAIRDVNADAQRIAKIIEDDPAMMARVLKVVNSPLYGGREPINSLQTAVARMGMNAVNNIAMSTSVFSTFGKEDDKLFDRKGYWRHCICAGIGAAIIYERCKANIKKRYTADVLHLCGLLHDIGKLVLVRYFHDDFLKAIRLADDEGLALVAAEKQTVGMDHAEIGGWLAARWKIPADLAQVVRYHHDPAAAPEEVRDLAMLCHCSNYICNLENLGSGGDAAAPSFQESAWTKLGLALSDISVIVDRITEESKKSEVLMAFV